MICVFEEDERCCGCELLQCNGLFSEAAMELASMMKFVSIYHSAAIFLLRFKSFP